MQFDNVHLQRDNPNVPLDIEQIPALFHFMRDNGQRPVGFLEAVSLITRADRLIADAHRLGSSATPPARTLCS